MIQNFNRTHLTRHCVKELNNRPKLLGHDIWNTFDRVSLRDILEDLTRYKTRWNFSSFRGKHENAWRANIFVWLAELDRSRVSRDRATIVLPRDSWYAKINDIALLSNDRARFFLRNSLNTDIES